MAEDSPQADMKPVTATPVAPTPSADQKTPTIGTTEPGAAPLAPGETPQPTQEEGLPEGVSERTRQRIEKLTNELRLEREMRLKNTSFFGQTPPAMKAEPMPLYDPTTGLLNEQAFNDVQRKAYEAEDRARRAEETLQRMEQVRVSDEDERQRREAVTIYPELDSSDPKKFDRNFHVATRRVLQDSILNPEDYGLKGKSLTYKEAADIAKGTSQKVLDQAKQEGAVQAMEQLSPKEQAALEATGTPGRREGLTPALPDLQYRTRKGDEQAIMERLKAVPWVNKG